ncbi:MAG: response regulator [Antarcticimicrobium sp.]|uniref:response regulator n=1 Tax=Antarcticimicrobium sp. TaxID=2824147 RepID=UPI0026329E2C|nr:response regulator [Antarcticimicrobium sp.]MDF1717076.1 response regulator [Antarcticimicrobium sp.]
MGANTLKFFSWAALLMAMLIFATTLVIVNARLSVTEALATDATEVITKIWYRHYFLHAGALEELALANEQDQVVPRYHTDPEAFGEIVFFRIFDKRGRLTLAATNAPEPGQTSPIPGGPPPRTEDDRTAVQTVLRSGMPITTFDIGARREETSKVFARSILPIRHEGHILGAAEVILDASGPADDIAAAFRRFSLFVASVLTFASLIPISVISYSWLRQSRLNVELTSARDSARHAEAVKSRFLANMSHEIRTPLNGIMGMADLLNETQMTEEQRDFSATILNSSAALLTIINDILDFSKIEAGKVTIARAPFDLHECVQDAAALLFPAGNGKGVELCVDFQTPLPAWVIGDEARLRQCLLNVAGNAVKFTEAGHVTIQVTSPGDDRIEISVRDTGIGIPQDKIDTIFRDFEQVEGTDGHQRTGTGLGLAITRKLLTLMGGDISVRSTPGKGSLFRMVLPLPATEPPEHAQTDVPVLFLDPGALRGKTAVVVDDLETNRHILTARLAGFGMRSAAYANTSEALTAVLDKRQPQPDVVISDHRMPGMDGADLLQALRADPATQDLPVVILSSGDLDALRAAFTRTDIDFGLSKPVRNDRLFKVLCRATKAGGTEKRSSAPPAGSDDSAAAAPQTARLRVGLAEDNKTNRFIVEKMIATRVACVIPWTDGQQAVDAYLAERPDVILMDISMPGKDGFTATREIRALERRAGLPPCIILALTAHAMAEDRTRSAEVGMDGFLSKPIRKAKLIEALEAASARLANRRAQSPEARDAG